MWRPMLLVVRVGESAFCGSILPPVTSPSLISAWKPLQIPSTRPSRSLSSFVDLLHHRLRCWNTVAKNFAEPSGSSPAENPPGNMMIWAWLMSFSNSSTDSRISYGVQVAEYPAQSPPRRLRSNAFALSYSQLVPGNTGINTVGCATLCLHT